MKKRAFLKLLGQILSLLNMASTVNLSPTKAGRPQLGHLLYVAWLFVVCSEGN